MSLTLSEIKAVKTDEDLLVLLSAELERRLPAHLNQDLNLLVEEIRHLPRGLRAMAATHRLDVSMAISDLGWHFYNFNHHGFLEETRQGLGELEAIEAAGIFQQASSLVEPHLERMEQMKGSPKKFADWYIDEGLEKVLNPLHRQLWKICATSPERGLLQFWLNYARKYPDRVLEVS